MKKIFWSQFKDKFMYFFEQDKGAVAILTGFLFVVLLGFAALAIDASFWYSGRRQLQLAADAGAVGGAIALKTTGKLTMEDYARNDIKLNNCTSENNCVVEAINNPPKSGPAAINDGAVEVILSKPGDTFLSGFFLSSPNLRVRAVAGSKPANNCVVSLASTGIGINVKGGASIVSPKCGVAANSTANNAINVVGGGSILTNSVTTAGGTNESGGGKITSSGGTTTGASAVADPLAGVPMPMPGACTHFDFSFNSGTKIIDPGVYCGGITLKSTANLIMNSGVYFLVQNLSKPGNFTAGAQTSIKTTGNGVTIVMTTTGGSNNFGTINFPAQITTNMSALSTGPTAGILFFGDRRSSGLTESFTGGNSQVMSGALYFPTNDVTYNGQPGITGNPCFQIIANTVTFTGQSGLGNGCSAETLSDIQLIE